MVDKPAKSRKPKKVKEEPVKRNPLFIKQQMHGILACGFDEIQQGWAIDCVCGFYTGVRPLMEAVGEEYDNHLRMLGILQDGINI